jgi:hypothetical protein
MPRLMPAARLADDEPFGFKELVEARVDTFGRGSDAAVK